MNSFESGKMNKQEFMTSRKYYPKLGKTKKPEKCTKNCFLPDLQKDKVQKDSGPIYEDEIA